MDWGHLGWILPEGWRGLLMLSSVRVYGEQRDLSFFLYERHLASKYFAAQQMGKRMDTTGDVLTRDSQASAG